MKKIYNIQTHPNIKFDFIIYFSLYFYQLIYLSTRQLYWTYNYDDNITLVRIVLSIILIFIANYIADFLNNTLKNDFFTCFKYFIIIPSLVIFSLSRGKNSYGYLFISIAPIILIAILSKTIKKNIEYPESKKFTNELLIVNKVLCYFSLIISLIILYLNIDIFNYSIYTVYENRQNQINNLPLPLKYSTTILISAILPFIFLISLKYKLYKEIILTVTIYMFLFLSTSNRIALFSPIILISYYILSYTKYKKDLINIFSYSCIILLLMAEINYTLAWEYCDVIFRRFLLDPSFTNYIYFDFFSTHEKYYLDHSKFNIRPTYELPFTNLIGIMQSANPLSNASVGMIGSSFARFGYFGILIYAILIIIIFRILLICKLPTNINRLITFYPIFTMITASDISTIFITHGFIFIMLIGFYLKIK